MTPPLTAEQRAGHAMVTRGMNKDMISQADQIVAGRSERQTRERKPRSCVRCEGERSDKFPVCASCRGEA